MADDRYLNIRYIKKISVVIRQGQNYGYKDHICTKEVIFEKSCGHQVNTENVDFFKKL